MGRIRTTPETLGALKPTRDDTCDAVCPNEGGVKGPARLPRGTRSITPGSVRVNDQKR